MSGLLCFVHRHFSLLPTCLDTCTPLCSTTVQVVPLLSNRLYDYPHTLQAWLLMFGSVLLWGIAFLRGFLAVIHFFLFSYPPVRATISHHALPSLMRIALFVLDVRFAVPEMPRVIHRLTILIKRRLGLSSNIFRKMKRKHESIDVIDFTQLDDEDGWGFTNSTTDGVTRAVPRHELNPGESRHDVANGSIGDDLLALIFSIFPGICPDFVEKLHKDQVKELSTPPTEETLANAILQRDGYPMKEDTKRRKLMEDKVEKSTRWGVGDNVKRDRRYFSSA